MAMLKKGSKGDEVLKLQQILNTQNYGLDEDGIFGTNTYNAVRDYQSKNGLGVDGIVGDETWGSLNALGNAGNIANPDYTGEPISATTPRGNTYNPNEMTGNQADLNQVEGGAPSFQGSGALNDALAALQQRLGNAPGEYVSPYQQQIEALYEQATQQRAPFQYDPNADPLYQMYRDRYTQNARQSMEETMANAAALTGGYGNSYAAAAAQQAYDQQMNGLNDALPELYGQAYQRYQDEGNQILERLALARSMDETEYGRYADQLQDYYDRLSAERALANDMYQREYGQYADQLAQYNADRNYYYQKTADDLAQQNYLNQLAMGVSGGSSGGRSSGGSGSSKKSSGSGSSAGTTADYKTVLNTAKGMTEKNAYAYVARMADSGVISNEQAYKILEVELGIDTTKYTTKTLDVTPQLVGGISGTINTMYGTAGAAGTGTTVGQAAKNGQMTLAEKLAAAKNPGSLAASAGNARANDIISTANKEGPSTTAGAVTNKITTSLNNAAVQAALDLLKKKK